MSRIICVITGLLMSWNLTGQRQLVIDSVANELKENFFTTSDPKQKAIIGTQLAEMYLANSPDSVLKYGNLGLISAREGQLVAEEIIILGFVGEAHIYQGNIPEALKLGFEALEKTAKYPSTASYIGPVQFNMIEIYNQLEDYEKALQYSYDKMEVGEKADDMITMAFGHLMTARTYEAMNELDSAALYLTSARHFFQLKSEELFRNVYDVYPTWYNIKAKIYIKQDNYKAALQSLTKGLQMAMITNDPIHISNLSNDLAKTYQLMEVRDSAIYYSSKALDEAYNVNYKVGIILASNTLAQEYENIDPAKALYYYKLNTTNQNQVYGANNIKVIQEVIELDQEKDRQIKALELSHQNRLKQYGLIGGLLALSSIAFILYRNNRRSKSINKKLSQTLDNLKATQTQLIQSEKMASLGELTAGVAHEIQNPLNFVNNFSDVSGELIDEAIEELTSQTLTSAPLSEQGRGNLNEATDILNDLKGNLEKISHHGGRASSIVKGMLDHSRASSGEKTPTDINALCDEYLRLSYHGLRAKDKSFNASFETQFDRSLPMINVVSQDIGQVLLNILNNAFYACNEHSKRTVTSATLSDHSSAPVDFAQDKPLSDHEDYKPKVTISTRRLSGAEAGGLSGVEVTITDNGTGMSQETIDKVFQPFYTTKPTGQGTGLGMSISYDIVTKGHGGELKVESTPAGREGKGSRFIIKLPILN